MAKNKPVTIVGGGLAGSECAYQLAKRGIPVVLYEMRPKKMTPAHQTGDLAELVCSNSFKADTLDTASGVLKAEMRRLDSLILRAADLYRVPAGKALAVDRRLFAQEVTRTLEQHPNITIRREEVTEIPRDGITVLATGPLTSEALTKQLRELLGMNFLYFFDAIAPSVERDSVDLERCFQASRYGHGEDYINCPMDEETYYRFVDALVNAEVTPLHDFEKTMFFEGCLPIEELARRGRDALRFGPLKPVGLVDPRTGEQPFAVVQLRQENLANTELGLVGFQTRLKYPEQRRVFRMIPGLEKAVFLRYGRMHRNLFVNSPLLLTRTFALRREPDIYLAGQITGVEGYLESAAVGLIVGIQIARRLQGLPPVEFPPETALGALVHYVTTPRHPFQPSNITWGMFAPLKETIRPRRARNEVLAQRALSTLEALIQRENL